MYHANNVCFQNAKSEEALTSELQQLRQQVNQKRTTMNDHVSHLDALRDEVSSYNTEEGGEISMNLEMRMPSPAP